MRQALLLVLALMAGCSLQPPVPLPQQQVEIADVAFFPQTALHCGPAALATLLQFYDIDAVPSDLSPRLQIPDRKGTLQIEMVAASRQYDVIPYKLDGGLHQLLSEVENNRPVLVLQNLGPTFFPKWHYAVVVGYDGFNDRIILRSGKKKRLLMQTGPFMGSWQRARQWGFVLYRPPDIPASANADGFGRSIVDNAQFLSADTVQGALTAGLDRWPDDPLLLFAAANHQRQYGSINSSANLYRRLLKLESQHIGGLNNYADLLLSQNCSADAAELIRAALQAMPEQSAFRPTVESTAQEIDVARRQTGKATPDACQQLRP